MSYDTALKERAVAYYQENKVPMMMQDVLNVMFRASPPDVNGYVSTYFEQFAKVPTISRLTAKKSLDSKGQPCLTVKIYCTEKNRERLAGQGSISIDTNLLDNSKPEEKEAEDAARLKCVEDAIAVITEKYHNLSGRNPFEQQTLDDLIYNAVEKERLKIDAEEAAAEAAAASSGETPLPGAGDDKKGGKKSAAKGSAKKKGAQVITVPDRKPEMTYPGWHAVSAVSKAISVAGAALSDKPLFEYLMLKYESAKDVLRLPLPMVTLIHSGKAALGKNNCIKEFMIVPRPDMSTEEAIQNIARIQEHIAKVLVVKNGVTIKNLNDCGALCPLLDKPEQALDLISDAANQLGLKMGVDFFYVLNASAHEYFDYEKGKYEVTTGVVKTLDDMADFWLDLINRYPAIIGLIDPLRVEEKIQWNKICETISEKCLVISEQGFSRPGLLIDQKLDIYDFATSGVIFRQDKCNTVSHLIGCSKKMRDLDHTVILAAGQHDTCDASLIDLAITCQARFIKLGGLNRGERILKYNKLIDYAEEFKDKLVQWEALDFKLIPPKIPTPEPIEDAADITEQNVNAVE